MATVSTATSLLDQKMKGKKSAKIGTAIFGVMLACGLIYIVLMLSHDLSAVHQASVFPYVLLGVALLTALALNS